MVVFGVIEYILMARTNIRKRVIHWSHVFTQQKCSITSIIQKHGLFQCYLDSSFCLVVANTIMYSTFSLMEVKTSSEKDKLIYRWAKVKTAGSKLSISGKHSVNSGSLSSKSKSLRSWSLASINFLTDL